MTALDTRDDYIRTLGSHGIDRSLALGLIDCFARQLERPAVPPSSEGTLAIGGLTVASIRYAIADDELQLLQNLGLALQGAAAAGFFLVAGVPVDAAAVAGTSLAISLVTVGRNLLKRGVFLNKDEFRILALLKSPPAGYSEDGLVEALQRASRHDGPGKPDEWDLERVRRDLAALSGKALLDGTVASLVARASDGRWYAAGV